jgi:hypothetical protein
MKREIVFAGLAMLALAASAAPAGAQFFGDYGYGGWGYSSYTTGPFACAKRYRSARVIRHRGISGFYLVSSPSHRADYPYNCHGSGYASTGFGRPINDWQRRLPMH